MTIKSTFLLLLFITTYFQISNAQIGITSPAESSQSSENVAPYDSTFNFVGSNVASLVGQRLYVRPKTSVLSGDYINYPNFRVSPTTEINHRRPARSIYAHDEGEGMYNSRGTAHEAIANTYFQIVDVEENDERVFLKLLHEHTGDTVYFLYPSSMSLRYIEEDDFPLMSSWPFIVEGFFERLKIEYLNEKLILKDQHLIIRKRGEEKYNPRTGLSSGSPVTHETGMVWKVVDVTIDSSAGYNIAFIIENEIGEQTTLPLNYASKLMVGNFMGVYYEDTAAELSEMLGEENFRSILQGEIQIGFTKTMVRLAMEPGYSVRASSISNFGGQEVTIWRYGADRYLYFNEDEVLVNKINW